MSGGKTMSLDSPNENKFPHLISDQEWMKATERRENRKGDRISGWRGCGRMVETQEEQ